MLVNCQLTPPYPTLADEDHSVQTSILNLHVRNEMHIHGSGLDGINRSAALAVYQPPLLITSDGLTPERVYPNSSNN